MNLRIALISIGIPPIVIGGMQSHSINLARGLCRLGVTVDLYYTDMSRTGRSSGNFEGLAKEPFNPIFVPWPARARLPGHFVRELKAFSAAVYKRYSQGPAADFIYAQGPTCFAFLKAKQNGVKLPPVGYNEHGYEMFQQASSFRNFLERFIMRPIVRRCLKSADVIFSFGGIFPELLTQVLGVSKERIAIVPNAVESHWIKTEPSMQHKPFRFIFVGRDEARKGILDLREALRRSSLHDFEFHFVGQIREAHKIAKPNVYYHGKITDDAVLQELLDSSDCLVCPSYAEGMPTVILEAMARGLAIIATDVGAVREMVGPENGILVPKPGARSIQEAMETILAMPSQQVQLLKESSLRKVRQFTWDNIAKMVLSVIQSKGQAKCH